MLTGLKLFLVVYNMHGGLVHAERVDPLPEKACMEYAAKQTMLYIGQLDVEGYAFNCEWHKAQPQVNELSRRQT